MYEIVLCMYRYICVNEGVLADLDGLAQGTDR